MPELRAHYSPNIITTERGDRIKVDNTLIRLYPITQKTKYIIYLIHSETDRDGIDRNRVSYAASNDETQMIPLDAYELVARDPIVNIVPAEVSLEVGIWSVRDKFRIQRKDEPYRNDTPSEEAFFNYLKIKHFS